MSSVLILEGWCWIRRKKRGCEENKSVACEHETWSKELTSCWWEPQTSVVVPDLFTRISEVAIPSKALLVPSFGGQK